MKRPTHTHTHTHTHIYIYIYIFVIGTLYMLEVAQVQLLFNFIL
jgi:hypothetical protein